MENSLANRIESMVQMSGHKAVVILHGLLQEWLRSIEILEILESHLLYLRPSITSIHGGIPHHPNHDFV